MSQAVSNAAADRNLLFGVLALQADLLDAVRFAEACSAWSARKDIDLADLLVQRGWLTPADRADVQRLLERKLLKHQGDVQAGLAEVTTDHLRRSLATVVDPVVQQTLATIAPATRAQENATVNYQPAGRDRYSLTRLHARGGMGQVWLARDTDLGREVALKELQEESTGDTTMRTRFVEEAKVTGQLEHPNIVPVYELARPDGAAPFYTMRFVRGRTLSGAIEAYHQKRLSQDATRLELRELLSQFMAVCNALAYAHSRGVIHRDLKPQNVVLGNYGEVIVLDWGLAKLKGAKETATDLLPVSVAEQSARGATVQGQALGTPSYMPPEQAEGRLDLVDERSDVYGLGAILYELLTGVPPFGGSDTVTIIIQVLTDPPVPPRKRVASVPRALEAVCLKALARRPAERYESAGELAQEVRRWLADEPVRAHAEPVTARAARWARRHRVLLVGCVAALVVAAAALAVTAAVVGGMNAELAGKNDALAEANKRERKAAERAQRTIEDMTSEEALKFLTTQKELRPEQRRFLEQVVAYYREATQEQAAGEEQRVRQAAAYFNMGQLQGHLGLKLQAEATYRAAVKSYTDLVAGYPLKPQYGHGLAGSYRNLATTLANQGKHTEAAGEFRAAIQESEQLVARYPDVPEYRHQLAKCRNSIGATLNDLGKNQQAEAEYHKGIKDFQYLVDRYPEVSEYRSDLANVHNSLANCLADQDDPRSEAEYRAAIKLQERLALEFPLEPEHRYDLAMTLSNRATVLNSMGKHRQAEADYRAAIKEEERLMADHPLVPRYRMLRAVTRGNVAQTLALLGQGADAEIEFRASIKDYERLVAENPAMPLYVSLMTEARNDFAELLRDLGKRREAEMEYSNALKNIGPLVAKYPQVPRYAARLGRAYLGFGNLACDVEEPAKALDWYGKAIATLEGVLQKVGSDAEAAKFLRGSRLGRAVARTHLGKHAEAILEVEELHKADAAKPDPLDGGFSFDASRVFARSGAAAKDAAIVERHAARAVALLRQAHAAQYFQSPHHLQRLLSEKDLDSLRSREDFKKLLAEAKVSAKK